MKKGGFLQGLLPSSIYDFQSKKLFGILSAEDLLLIALIFLFLEKDDGDNILMILALGYILLSDIYNNMYRIDVTDNNVSRIAPLTSIDSLEHEFNKPVEIHKKDSNVPLHRKDREPFYKLQDTDAQKSRNNYSL